MKTNLIAAIDTASAHTMAAPAAVTGQSGSVPISVLLIIVLSGVAWWMYKHGKDTKKLQLLPGFICCGLGLSLSGTQVGTMVAQLFGTFASMIATFASNA
ncbi:hypothetical protein [Streptomyces liangshanensis]|uniref:hypothetical protein n=1 Tax=Streptomyces liangshanensis TaxID=2717324 RepID=UPI0036DC51A1